MAVIGNGGTVIEGSQAKYWKNAGAPVDGTSGTYAGLIGPGELLVDTTNKNLYINGGTQASPTYKLVTRAA